MEGGEQTWTKGMDHKVEAYKSRTENLKVMDIALTTRLQQKPEEEENISQATVYEKEGCCY